jgi:predicted nucleotidyltransferase component of viral defense system
LTDGTLKNIVASVHQRLLNEAKRSARPFNELLQYYTLERFLYRLSRSPHAAKFVLKGALMLRAWRVPQSRPTMDIDLLGRTANEIDKIAAIMQEVCVLPVEADGLTFDPVGVRGQRIAEDAEYEGVRVVFSGQLGKARVPMQIDIGFGDVVSPSPVDIELPTILDFPAPRLRGYTRETAIAEKFQAMAKLGLLNSRMKDFYDIWVLSRQGDFTGATLANAILRTFENRDTELVALPLALTPAFSRDENKIKQWQAFVRKLRLEIAPAGLEVVVAQVAEFLQPVTAALVSKANLPAAWRAPGPWTG